MKTLKFPQKDIVELSEEQISYINEKYKPDPTAKNGLVKSVIWAYNKHHILSISPDDMMNTICCVWAKYIFLNAERFRNQIVTHEGQKKITILTKQNTRWDNELLIHHMNQYISAINSEQDSLKWMDVEFSTTSELDKMIRNVAMLSSQKAYYSYHSRTMCWLPQINLLGTEEDWVILYDKIKWMPCYDRSMIDWKNKLLTVLDKFIIASEEDVDFWQAPLTYNPGGSGSIPYYTGWITVFNPFNEKGEWAKTQSNYSGSMNQRSDYYFVPVGDIIDLTVDFEIICEDDSGKQHGTLKVFAGPTSIQASKELGLQLKNKLYFSYHQK
jgi:hypothetical protein